MKLIYIIYFQLTKIPIFLQPKLLLALFDCSYTYSDVGHTLLNVLVFSCFIIFSSLFQPFIKIFSVFK